jgi:two-component system sensor histidine kinase RegB
VEAGARRLVLATALVGDALEISARDDGPGFAEEVLMRLGQPYTSTKPRPGAGLGLFLLVNVIRSLGGAVQATNPPSGGGEVRLSLPLVALAPKEEAGHGR